MGCGGKRIDTNPRPTSQTKSLPNATALIQGTQLQFPGERERKEEREREERERKVRDERERERGGELTNDEVPGARAAAHCTNATRKQVMREVLGAGKIEMMGSDVRLLKSQIIEITDSFRCFPWGRGRGRASPIRPYFHDARAAVLAWRPACSCAVASLFVRGNEGA